MSKASKAKVFSLMVGAAALGAVLGTPSSAHAAVVLDQIGAPSSYPRGNGSVYGSKSGHFVEPQYNFFSTAVVDDFMVTDPTRDLTNVSAAIFAQGGTFTTFGAIPGWEVAIYSSLSAAQSSLTGDVADVYVPASDATLTTGFSNNGDNNALVSLPINIELPAAGTYYLSILSRNPLDTTGWVDVYDFGSAGGANAYNEAPYATAGPTSTLLTGGDAAYRIIGQAPAGGVPEPSALALVALAGVAGLGVTLCRRARFA